MQKEKNILVNRGQPMTRSSLGVSVSPMRQSFPGRSMEIRSTTVGGYNADWDDLSDGEISRIMQDLNIHYLRGRIISSLGRVQSQIDTLYTERSVQVGALVEQKLSAAGFVNSHKRDGIANNKRVVDGLVKQQRKVLKSLLATAKLYSGGDPLTLTQSQRSMIGAKAMGTSVHAFPERAKEQLKSYETSYKAAKEARVQTQILDRLVNRSTAISQQLVAVDAATKVATDKAAKQARLAQEVQAKRVADQQARAAEAVRRANTFHVPSPALASGALFMTSAGAVGLADTALVALQAAIRAAISALIGAAISAGAVKSIGVFAMLAPLFYSSKLANGELPERYAFSTPVSDIAPNLGQNLNAAAAGHTVDLPYRISSKTAVDGQSEVFLVKTDGVIVPSKVRVVAASYDAAQKVYAVTTADLPPRTLIWTPVFNPGNSSTTSPAAHPTPPVYTGASVTPVEGRLETFPAVSEASFDDFITVFPVDSGLPPIYTMFRDRREDSGVATGVGQPVVGNWLVGATQSSGAPIPSQIADQLRGKEFRSFRGFRKAFWKAVANDPELSKQFNPASLAVMKEGRAAYARESEQVGGRIKVEIHHKNRIIDGGNVYYIDNLSTVTPKRHIEIHKGDR